MMVTWKYLHRDHLPSIPNKNAGPSTVTCSWINSQRYQARVNCSNSPGMNASFGWMTRYSVWSKHAYKTASPTATNFKLWCKDCFKLKRREFIGAFGARRLTPAPPAGLSENRHGRRWSWQQQSCTWMAMAKCSALTAQTGDTNAQEYRFPASQRMKQGK